MPPPGAGGGGVLYKRDRPSRFFHCTWKPSDFSHLEAKVGDCSAQTFFEVLVLVLAVELWAKVAKPAIILGDNVPALQEALALRGKGDQEPHRAGSGRGRFGAELGSDGGPFAHRGKQGRRRLEPLV